MDSRPGPEKLRQVLDEAMTHAVVQSREALAASYASQVVGAERYQRSDCREGCGREHKIELPQGVPAGVLGPRAMAAVGVLSGHYHLSKRMIEDLFEDLFGLTVSLGVVSRTEERLSEAGRHR